MKFLLVLLAALAFVALVNSAAIPHTACSGINPSTLSPYLSTDAAPNPKFVSSGAGYTSFVDSTNLRLVFRGSNLYNSVKFEIISPSATEQIGNDVQATKGCNGYFNTPAPQDHVEFWNQYDSDFCGSYFSCCGACYHNPSCCGCSYNPYFVYSQGVTTALNQCFLRSESADGAFYYFDTVVQTTYTVNRAQIRYTPIIRTVIGQVNLRFKFQKMIQVSTVNNAKAIFVGGLRQVYADVVTLFFNPLSQQVYVEVYTSVQWPYKLAVNFITVTPHQDLANNQYGFEFVGTAPYATVLANTTAGFAYGKNCDVLYGAICEQIWAFNVTMPSFNPNDPNGVLCQMNPTFTFKMNVGCQDLYEGNCTVGESTRYSDFAFASLPFNDFCVNIVQDTGLTGNLLPYNNLVSANTGGSALAKYSYVYGGPIYLRITLTLTSTTGVIPQFSSLKLQAVKVYSGAGSSVIYNFNISSNANDFVKFDSNDQNWMVFTFSMNQDTVTLANFDENQVVQVSADIRVTFKNIPAPVSKGFDLQEQVQATVTDTNVAAQFVIESSTTSSAAAGSSMNVVAVAAGSAAGVVALTVVVAFLVHRRSIKQIEKSAPTSKEDEETEPSVGGGSTV